MRKAIYSIITSLCLSSCVYTPEAAVVPDLDVPSGLKGSVPTSATDCQYYLFGLFSLNNPPSVHRALEKARAAINMQVLTDASAKYSFWFTGLFTSYCAIVNAKGVPGVTPIPTPVPRKFPTPYPTPDTNASAAK